MRAVTVFAMAMDVPHLIADVSLLAQILIKVGTSTFKVVTEL